VGDRVSIPSASDFGFFQIFNLDGDAVDLESGIATGSQVIAAVSVVPEPGTSNLILIGIGLVLVIRKRMGVRAFHWPS
jgi:hypothetical protein